MHRPEVTFYFMTSGTVVNLVKLSL